MKTTIAALALATLAACVPTIEETRQAEPLVFALPGTPQNAADCVAGALDVAPLLPPLPEAFPPMVRRRGAGATVFLSIDGRPVYVVDFEPDGAATRAKAYGALLGPVAGAMRGCGST